jgi:hypothetical protein
MADLLVGAGFGDGAFFHAYTAMENMMGAVLLAHNKTIADNHHDDIVEGIRCLQGTKPVVAAQAQSVFSRLEGGAMNRCLYVRDNGVPPGDRFEFQPQIVKPLLVELRELLTLVNPPAHDSKE